MHLPQKLEAEYLQEKRETGGQGRVAKFNYAVALSKSVNPDTKRKVRLHELRARTLSVLSIGAEAAGGSGEHRECP